jgi:hypothetical protein
MQSRKASFRPRHLAGLRGDARLNGRVAAHVYTRRTAELGCYFELAVTVVAFLFLTVIVIGWMKPRAAFEYDPALRSVLPSHATQIRT